MGNVRATLRLGLAILTAFGWLLTAGAGAEATEVFGAAQDCHPSYQGTCIPTNVPDADCAGGTGNGPHFVQERNIRVVGADPYDLDGDGNGVGCQITDLAMETPTPTTTAPASQPVMGPPTTATTAQTTATTRATTATTGAITALGLPNTGAPVERQVLAAALLVAAGIYVLRHSERYQKQRMP